MGQYWVMGISRDDLAATTVLEGSAPECGDGDVLLRVDRVGLTANNVTYAVLGDAFRYWEFFPAGPEIGLVPLWGFAEVVESRAEGIEAGERIYGYLPPASHLLIAAGRVDERGFTDSSPHRAALPSPYNAYQRVTADPAYEVSREDLQILFRPLFWTSFMLADQLADTAFTGAESVVMSSASSKTAYGTAFLLKDEGPKLIGLTSASNREFTESLGCYDEVITYGEISSLDASTATAYVDFAGNQQVRAELHAHLKASLVLDLIVGITHQDGQPAGTLEGARPSAFFAPDQIRKRTADWGPALLDEKFAQAWFSFAPTAEQWVDVQVSHGSDALQDVWNEVHSGRSAPRIGHVITL